jgi:hypothetical protein
MWLVDLGSTSNGGRYQFNTKLIEYNLYPFSLIHNVGLISIITGNCPPSDIGAARICPTQGPFCTVQLFGAGTRQYKGVQRVYWNQFPNKMFYGNFRGPHHYSAAGRRSRSFRCIAWDSMVCSCVAPVLCFCCDQHWIQVLQLCPRFNSGNIWWSC